MQLSARMSCRKVHQATGEIVDNKVRGDASLADREVRGEEWVARSLADPVVREEEWPAV